MRPHARRLLFFGLLATLWGGDANAAPEASREPSPAVPQEPVEAPRTKSATSPRQLVQASAPAASSPSPTSDEASATPGDEARPKRSGEAIASDANTSSPHSSGPASPLATTAGTRRLRKRSRSPGTIELVPRQFGLELGWSNLAIDNLPDILVPDPRPHPHGVATGSHVMWQIAGLSRRWPTWIGPRIGLDVFPATPVSRRVIAASYGFQFKHQFGRHPRVRPFLSYGAGAVQSWVKTIPGREIGHQLQTSFGAAFPVAEQTSLTFAFAYKFHGLATFRWDDAGTLAYNFHTVGLLAGITLDAPPRRTRPRRRSGKAPPRAADPSAPRTRSARPSR